MSNLPGRAAEVDALVAAIAPRVPAPPVRHRDAVLVTGPRLAGASAVATALASRLPDRVIVEAGLDSAAPAVVVFVVSAAAALTDSDCALLAAAAAHTDAVIGVVSKADRYRHWPQMVSLARDTLAGYAPRYRKVRWVAAAAPPDLGEPRIDDLLAELAKLLDDPALPRRNRLRSWERQLRAVARRYRRDAATAAADARAAGLRQRRDAALRERRLARAGQTIRLRSQIAAARVRLTRFAGDRCTSIRAELADDVAGLTRRRLAGFERSLRHRVAEVIDEVDRGAAEQLTEVAAGLELGIEPPRPAAALPEIAIAGPALRSGRLETRLMALLGTGFGLGVALTLGRLLAGLPPGLTTAGAAGSAVAGLAATVWVVGARTLLHDRALLDRWVAEVIANLRSSTEELVALRVLAAESAFSAELAERHEAGTAATAAAVAALDAELREHAAAAARTAAVRDSEAPAVLRALAAVRAELGEPVEPPGVSANTRPAHYVDAATGNLGLIREIAGAGLRPRRNRHRRA